ncbi:MAG: hypothetical protein IH987_22410 [Planctomycetes bacterium]|nr:hypothetical protein [Planctomycetota bacterium]
MASESEIYRERDLTRHQRQAPTAPCRLTIGVDADGTLGKFAADASLELTLETTDADGEIATWFDDSWWTEIIDRFGEKKLTIHIAPTPGALLHLVILYHLDMIYRVAPQWRVVGHAYRNDLDDSNAVAKLAKGAYHEVRFFDQDRPGTMRSDRGLTGLPLDELFGQIRHEQTRLGRTAPVLVRVPSSVGSRAERQESERRSQDCSPQSA